MWASRQRHHKHHRGREALHSVELPPFARALTDIRIARKAGDAPITCQVPFEGARGEDTGHNNQEPLVTEGTLL